nr:uncharacterized protein LOC114921302 [Labrus bergylta]
MRTIKDLPFSGSAWFLHHLSAASGCNFQASLLQKSKNWSPAIVVWLKKVLTERYGAAETELISCCFKESEVKQAPSIRETSKKKHKLKGQIRQKESVMGSKVLMERDSAPPSKAFVNQYEAFKAASLHPSDKSQLQRQRKAARVIKKNDYLNFLFQNTVQREQSLKASGVYDDDDDDDGFYVKRKVLLVPREEPESINKLRYKTRATLDDNKEDFSGRIITKQAEPRRPEGESATERSHTHIEKAKRERLACTLQVGFTDKTDNNDDKQMLSEVGDDILIMFFLADAEREEQTEGKVILDADIKWKTVNIPIKEPDDPPPLDEVTEENFIIQTHNSKCKHLKEISFLLGIYAASGDVKAEKVTTKSAETEKRVKATTERIEQSETNNTTRWNTSINHRKQDAPSEESVIPSPPSIKMTELEAAKTETTAVNMEIKQTTPSGDAFNQCSTTTTSPDSETDTETRFMRFRTTRDARETTTGGKAFSASG